MMTKRIVWQKLLSFIWRLNIGGEQHFFTLVFRPVLMLFGSVISILSPFMFLVGSTSYDEWILCDKVLEWHCGGGISIESQLSLIEWQFFFLHFYTHSPWKQNRKLILIGFKVKKCRWHDWYKLLSCKDLINFFPKGFPHYAHTHTHANLLHKTPLTFALIGNLLSPSVQFISRACRRCFTSNLFFFLIEFRFVCACQVHN